MAAHAKLDDALGRHHYQTDQGGSRDSLNEWPLIPNVYEPIEQSEACRARSASPRLENNASFHHPRELCSIRQNSDLAKMRAQRIVPDHKAKLTGSTQPSNRFQESGYFNNQTRNLFMKRRLKGGYLGQQRPAMDWKLVEHQSRRSNWEDWLEAGDRLFSHSSRNRQ
ncbi:hypothetical protein G7Z17_g11382 [Cylindrodendrum hubeiense]|uniref:Uncharacterized protein n=1 Tax=Cylindrodendrum hubeiense TaxID=595255 RepID=A0A9P5H146_9HYPO|nr:hypothetical protein G7Z17_g11382 [Cylindrodendrum hubeiense]